MADLQQLEESIVGLSLLEAADLVKKLEARLGVSAAAAAPVMVAGGAAAGGSAAPAEEKTEFTVVLKEVGANKINVIKAVREVTRRRIWSMALRRASKRACRKTKRRRSRRSLPKQERWSKSNRAVRYSSFAARESDRAYAGRRPKGERRKAKSAFCGWGELGWRPRLQLFDRTLAES